MQAKREVNCKKIDFIYLMRDLALAQACLKSQISLSAFDHTHAKKLSNNYHILKETKKHLHSYLFYPINQPLTLIF
jgi:hypothetical protein